jgi:hypothetical protein
MLQDKVVYWGLIIGVVAGITMGCTTTGKQTSAPEPQPAVVDAASSVESSAAQALPPIPELVRTFVNYPRANYRHAEGKYTYYIGGVLNAEYINSTGQLVLDDNNDLTCTYDRNGALITQKEFENEKDKEKYLGSLKRNCEPLVRAFYQAIQ